MGSWRFWTVADAMGVDWSLWGPVGVGGVGLACMDVLSVLLFWSVIWSCRVCHDTVSSVSVYFMVFLVNFRLVVGACPCLSVCVWVVRSHFKIIMYHELAQSTMLTYNTFPMVIL